MSHEQTETSTPGASKSHSQNYVELSERMRNDSSTCVICLESIAEQAIALPCAHADFDFACLGAWLQRQSSCPLCKAIVHGIKYDLEASGGPKVFPLPLPQFEPSPSRPASGESNSRRGPRPRSRGYSTRDQHGADQESRLERRRQVYEERTYSLHVGSNRLSRYRNLSPQAFQEDKQLVHRARIWIRRELQVFRFLNSDSAPEVPSKRRARNAEFLGEYVVATIRSIDIRGSTGQAEELIQEFLGRDNARLFLHELESWLRSPYERVQDWDEAVQYDNHAWPSRT